MTTEREAELAKLRTKWGLPEHATPPEIAQAELRQEALVQSYFTTSCAAFIASVRALGEELGVNPDPEGVGGAHWPAVWAAIRDSDHRYCRLSRTADGVGWIVPPAVGATS